MKLPVSAIVLTHNNEATIANCLTSLSWSNDICIIDDYSTDDTLRIAAKFSARIFQRKLNTNYSQQRNFALSVAKAPWVFFVDSDEVVTDMLTNEIAKVIQDRSHKGYSVPRVNIQYGKRMRYGEFFRFRIVRLGKKDSGNWVGSVHETWRIKGSIGVLQSPLLHYQTGGIHGFLSKVNEYSTLRASELFVKKKKSGFMSILFLPVIKLLQNYFLKLGFLDGIGGLLNAIGMSFYTFLVRAKLWLLWHETYKEA